MNTLTSTQLEQKAEDFVNEYRNASDDEISKIVAGMTAVIEGNEYLYERMRNQKWFERIWYGLTLKNKASVKEMQSKRELLTKYTIQILVKMNILMDEHSECICDLYRALAVVRRDIGVVIDEMSSLAHKLNEKITSIDNYYYILNEIRNNKFDVNFPLISLIDIMSLIDSRTANDTRKLIQLKETMEKMGFDFSEKIDILTYSNEILSLPEDRVGRILLFCQSFSHRSRFLAYTCSLMENYFYLWDSDKRIVKENGEAVTLALDYSGLNPEANCVVGEMFNDLKGAMRDAFEITEIPDAVAKPLSPANYYSTKTTKPLNVIVVGMTGSGKSTLINSIFGWNVSATGLGQSVTTQTSKYCNDEDNITIYDTVGFQINSADNSKFTIDIKAIMKNHQTYVLWYCINSTSNRYEDTVLKELHSLGIPMIIVLTKSIDDDNQLEADINKSNSGNVLRDVSVVPVLAKDYTFRDMNIPAFGLEELIDKTIEIMS